MEHQPDRELAMDLVEAAWDADAGFRAQLALEALAADPGCAEAFIVGASAAPPGADQAAGMLRAACALARQSVGDRFTRDLGELWTAGSDAKTYVRALYALANNRAEAQQYEEAIVIYRRLLGEVDRDDSVGARFTLPAVLLLAGFNADFNAFRRRMAGETRADWLYTDAFSAWRNLGQDEDTDERMDRALESNPFIPGLLTDEWGLPQAIPTSISPGGTDEAAAYAMTFGGRLWRADPGALAALRTRWLSTGARQAAFERPQSISPGVRG